VSEKGSWIGIAFIAAIAVLLVFSALLKVGGHWAEIGAVAVFLGTLAYGLTR
jgi:protein-S-isoprenylcysteine O-methyltransferase Ste14